MFFFFFFFFPMPYKVDIYRIMAKMTYHPKGPMTYCTSNPAGIRKGIIVLFLKLIVDPKVYFCHAHIIV